MTARSLAALCLALALLAIAPTALAARSYDNCTGFIDSLPASVSTPGTWCLRKDLNTAITSGAAIELVADDITVDCNDFKLGNLQAGSGTQARGFFTTESQSNLTVRNCNVRGFLIGLDLYKSHSSLTRSGHVVEDNRFDGVTCIAIRLQSSGSVIRRNRVVNVGGSTSDTCAGFAAGIVSLESAVLSDNVVSSLRTLPFDSAVVQGILSSSNSLVTGNVISLAPGPGITGWGINAVDSVIRDNEVRNIGAWAYGIGCNSNFIRRNVVAGFPAYQGLYGCESDDGNVVVDAP